MRTIVFILALLLALPASAQSEGNRPATDFEIASAERDLRENAVGFSRIAALLNLGDLHRTRSESRHATAQFTAAGKEADRLRVERRKASDIDGYARATGYSALAHARLGHRSEALSLFEESTRYIADSGAAWNLFASGMLTLGEFAQATYAAKNAVTVAQQKFKLSAARGDLLDLNVYRYTLASAFIGAGSDDAAIRTLESVVASLESSTFDPTRAEITRNEEFEILSSVKRDSSAFVSLFARANLRLGALHEKKGNLIAARARYRKVLDQRSDEPHALTALARLPAEAGDRNQLLLDAFDANPFSLELVSGYLERLKAHPPLPASNGTGGGIRRAIEAIHRGDYEHALTSIEKLRKENSSNDIVLALSVLAKRGAGRTEEAFRDEEEIASTAVRRFLLSASEEDIDFTSRLTKTPHIPFDEKEFTQLAHEIKRNRLTPPERVALDSSILQQSVRPDSPVSNGTETSFIEATIGTIRIRFAQTTNFHGVFTEPSLLLTFRILGWSEDDRGGALLVEPLGLSR